MFKGSGSGKVTPVNIPKISKAHSAKQMPTEIGSKMKYGGTGTNYTARKGAGSKSSASKKQGGL